MSKKHILIADTDSEALGEFSQALGEQWDVTGVASGTAALAELEKKPFDVLVADLNLPELDGAGLLNRTRRDYPKTICFILAVEADRDRVMTHVMGAHQLITKPCDKATLKSTIERTLALDMWIANDSMRELVARVRTFPTVPSLYLEVISALRSPNATTEQVGGIIAKDMAMMTKLLQVINSACFGLSRKITNPVEAVGLLGFEAVKSMVMTIKLLSQYDKVKPIYFSIDRLWRHSTDVARTAKQLTLMHTEDHLMAEAAFTAGLIHDLGKVVLASNFDEQYRGAQALACKQRLPLWEVEKEIFGASHGEIGAYLLGLWGMPLDLLEVAALHHQPSRTIIKGFTTLTAVHVANALEYEVNPDKDGLVVSKIDEAYLAEIGVLSHLPVWREAALKREFNKPQVKAKPQAKTKPTEKIAATKSAAPARASAPKSAALQPAPKRLSVGPAWSFSRTQWAYTGVAGGGALLLLLAWLTLGQLKHHAEKPQAAKTEGAAPGLVVRARTIPAETSQVTTAGEPAKTKDGTPQNVAVSPRASSTATVKVAPKPLVFSELKLQGIFFSSSDPSAIISGQTVHRNDRVAGATVRDIGPSSVTLEFQNQKKTLALK